MTTRISKNLQEGLGHDISLPLQGETIAASGSGAALPAVPLTVPG